MTDDRLRASLATILAEMLPNLLALARWEYQVQIVDAGPPVKITAKATDPRVPNAVKVTLRPGPSGGYATPIVGSSVLIGFANGDFTKPFVDKLDAPNKTTKLWLPSTVSVELADGTQKQVARVDDEVTITQAELNAAVAVAGANPVTITNPIVCKITSGSTKVSAA